MAKPVLSAPRFHNEEAAFAFIEEWLCQRPGLPALR